MTGERLICLAQIGAAHGIKGHVRVKPFTEHPENLGDYGRLKDETGSQSFKIAGLRPIKGGMLVVKFKGVNDRNEAEKLNGIKLYVTRDMLPELDDDDDFYVEDLVGLPVFDEKGDPVGKVLNVQNFGADDLLDIQPDQGQSLLVPFTKAAVPVISIKDQRIEINRHEAGLTDDDEPAGEDKASVDE